jgi:parallel beta-helix repeat protein
MTRSPLLLILIAALTNVCQAKTIRVPGDHPDIRTALTAAEEGDRIEVAPGTYRGRLVLKPHVVLRAEAGKAEQTVIDGSGGEGPGVTMAEGAALDGFTVTGVGSYDETLWQKHRDERGRDQPHSDIGGFGVPAIAADGVSCRIRNCLVHHNGHTGIVIRGRKDEPVHAIVTGNRCWRNMGGGIGIMDGAGGIVQGNECSENFLAGIGHSGNAAPLVVDNHCHDNVRAGIGVSEGACPVVRGNRCHNNRRAGIGIRTGAETRPVIENNECQGNGMAGIGVSEGAEPILRGNRCTKNELAGIGAEGGSRILAVANECRENGASGIGLSSGCEGILWRNICDANAAVAVGLPDKARAILAGNTLSRDGGAPPLVAIKGGSEAILTGNELNGGGVAGVLVEGRAIFTDNTLNGQAGKSTHGIWLWKGGAAFGSGNSVQGYKTPVTVAEGAEWTGEQP